MSVPRPKGNDFELNVADQSAGEAPAIRWPAAYQPASAPVFAHNEIVIPAQPDVVWACLLRAKLWPTWYANSSDVQSLSDTGPGLGERSRFRWKTFGLVVTCEVRAFKAASRLAWEAHRSGVAAWHAWLLTPLKDGSTHVLTDEVQHGWLSRLGKLFTPGRMQTQHQLWLEGLRLQAEAGAPQRTPAHRPVVSNQTI